MTPPIDDDDVNETWFREDEEDAAEAHRLFRRLRVERRAHRLEAAQHLRLPPQRDDYSLASLMAEPIAPEPFVIAEAQRAGQNALTGGVFKFGKTSTLNDLARCLVDGEPWLGVYDTALDGNVGIWQAEMNPADVVDYWQPLGVRNTDRIRIWNQRGYAINLLTDPGTDAAVRWLVQNEIGYLIIDPWQSYCAWSGVNSNDNDDVAALLDRLDQIKTQADVPNLNLVAHMGRGAAEHGAEHVRGATRLDDWADVRWLLTKDANDVRYFRAHGRGVDFAESALVRDEHTHRLSLGEGSRAVVAFNEQVAEVVRIVTENNGINSTGIKGEMRTIADQSKQSAAIKRAERQGRIFYEQVGSSHCWHLCPDISHLIS